MLNHQATFQIGNYLATSVQAKKDKQHQTRGKKEVRETFTKSEERKEKNTGLLTEDLFRAMRAMIKRMLNLDAQISGRYVPSTQTDFKLSNTD